MDLPYNSENFYKVQSKSYNKMPQPSWKTQKILFKTLKLGIALLFVILLILILKKSVENENLILRLISQNGYEKNDGETTTMKENVRETTTKKENEGETTTKKVTKKEPRQLLNEKLGVDKLNYTEKQNCQPPIYNPTHPIWEVELRINIDEYKGKSWIGKARQKNNAQKLAAFNAIKKDIPEFLDLIIEPDENKDECIKSTSSISTTNSNS